MKNKNKIILITLMSLLFIIAITIVILNKTGIINRINQNSKQEEIKKEISYEVYKHANGQTAMLVIAEDTENGIQKIIYPNNEMELYCNGKTKVAFDYNTDITGKESLTFIMVNTLGEEIEKTIAINDQFYLDMINHSLTKETETQKALTVNYKEGSVTKQYKIGETQNWTDYTNKIRLDDYQILETLGNENREPHIYLKQVDKIGNEIIVESKLKYKIDENVTYNQEDTVIEGESILACVENNNLETGNYIFKVTGTAKDENAEGVFETKTETIEYPVELYNYNEDANYISNNVATIDGREYTGMGNIGSEKRMLILKYNGNLNINSEATITPTGTSKNINGATYLCTKKGMFIYCAGTLTNNGTITMTAKGTVNQEGENVYLYKNEDNTYEYVPAIGANGGTSVQWTSSGIIGEIGINRKTGGGGSGSAYRDREIYKVGSGAGGTGTAYSGGTGGGSAASISLNGRYGGDGSSTGGIGGYASSWEGMPSTGGGAGNPGGSGSRGGYAGETGTGGLLIIYSNTIINNGTINSNGSNGGYASRDGGSSGGGSINLFYKETTNKGNINANGGSIGNGGAGGAGSITIGNISTGTFVKDE